MIKKIILCLFIFFVGVINSYAINTSDDTGFSVSKEIQYTLTGVTSDPLEEVSFSGSYSLTPQIPGYCRYYSSVFNLYYHTRSYLDTLPSFYSTISSDSTGKSWGGTSGETWCNSYANNTTYYNSGVSKDFFYYDLPYGNSNSVFVYNSDGNLRIQQTHGINEYSSLAFSSKYFLYNNIYVSYGGDTLSYSIIDYDNLDTSLLDTRPYPSGFLTPSYIPFPYVDDFGDMKGWLYSCNSNNSICFLSANGNYFREVVINSAGKLIGPLVHNGSDTKFIFSSDLGNNVVVYNSTFNESNGNIDLVEFEAIKDGNGDNLVYFSGSTLDIMGNYDYTKNRVYLNDFNNVKSSGDDRVYFYDLNCVTPGYTASSYFADENKFYCASDEGDNSLLASDGNYYASSCYNDIISGGFICDDSIKSPNLELGYNHLTGENAGYDPNNNGGGGTGGGGTGGGGTGGGGTGGGGTGGSGDSGGGGGNTGSGTSNTPLNGLGTNGCDYFDSANIESCNSGEYLSYDNGSLICDAIGGDSNSCDSSCTPYLYLDFWGCATDVLDPNNNQSNTGTTNNYYSDNSGIIDTLENIFGFSEDQISGLQDSLSGALNGGGNGFAIGGGGTSGIDFVPGNNDYGVIIGRDDQKLTCDMFNVDGSFAYYSNGSYDLSIDLNGLLDLGYADKVPFLEELLFIPNKILSFITNPLQNIFSTLRVFGGIGENTYCYFGTLQTIEFQKHIKVGTSFFGGELIFIPGTLTIIDYLIMFFLGLPLLIVSVRILLY